MAELKKSVSFGGVSTQILNRGGYYYGYVVTDTLSAAVVDIQEGNTISGVATINPYVANPVSFGITNANPGVVTTSAEHGLSTGDVVTLTGVGGMVEILDTTRFTITVINSTSFSIGVDTTLYTPHTTGGTVNKVVLGAKFEHIPASTAAGTTKMLASPIRFDGGLSTTTTATGAITLIYD